MNEHVLNNHYVVNKHEFRDKIFQFITIILFHISGSLKQEINDDFRY